MIDNRDRQQKFQEDNGISALFANGDEAERASVVRELMHQLGDQSENRRVVYSSYPACNSDD